MKNFYFALLSLLTTYSYGQTILLLEDFSGAPQYLLTEMPEQIVSPTDYFTRTDGTNIASPINFTDNQPYFSAQDIDTAPMVSPATMLFNDIDINTYNNLTFGVGLAEHDASDGNEDWDSSDFVHFEYQIDNSGVWKNLVWVENDGSTFNSAPQIDTDFNGDGDGMIITNEFNEDVIFNITDTGSLIDIRVTFGGLDSLDEDIAIDVIYLINNFDLLPYVTITAPNDTHVFPSGTSNVNIEYFITNTPERVDIDVNGLVTSNIANNGPFNVTTEDGGVYTAKIMVYSGGIEVSSETVNFSIDATLNTTKNDINKFSLYPNPNSLGYLNILSKSTKTFQANVYDILGKKVISKSVKNNKLNISELNNGVYIIKLIQGQTTTIKKLVVK